MPVYKANAGEVANQIHRLATTSPLSRGRAWMAKVETKGAEGKRYNIRAWNPAKKDDHQCWVNFDITMTSDEETAVTPTLCNDVHDSMKAREHVMRTIQQMYEWAPVQ